MWIDQNLVITDHYSKSLQQFITESKTLNRLTYYQPITGYYCRPQMKFGARWYFYTCLSFCSKWGGGSLPQCMLGYQPPPTRHTPPPPRTMHPPTPPRDHATLPRDQGDTVNAWAVRILLECNLVTSYDHMLWSLEAKVWKEI